METYFMLISNKNAEKKDELNRTSIFVSSGSLWALLEDRNSFSEYINLRSCELIDVTLKCIVSDLMRINDIELQLLLAIENLHERLRLVKQTNLLQYGCDLFETFTNSGGSSNDEVMINIRCIRGTLESVQGFIKYIGSIPGRSGLWFGVELIKRFSGIGTTDGSICGKRFFECRPNCALFISLDKISIISEEDDLNSMYASIDEAKSGHTNGHLIINALENDSVINDSICNLADSNQFKKSTKAEAEPFINIDDINCNASLITDKNDISTSESSIDSQQIYNSYTPTIEKSNFSDRLRICTEPNNIPEYKIEQTTINDAPLIINERIVWVSDFGPELGLVKWIGILPNSSNNEITVGVEFDRPIGTGTGKYNGEQLFRTPPKHASLIPILGLMRAEEFFGAQYKYEPIASNEKITHSYEKHNKISNRNALAIDSLEMGSEKRLIKSECCTPSSEDGTPKRQKFKLSRPPPPPGKCALPEKSIYDDESDPCYENMEAKKKKVPTATLR